MSRVGSSAIAIPADVTLSNDGGVIVVKGKNGELSTSLHSDVELSVADNVATLKPAPRGVLSDTEARTANVGGEVLCHVF